MDNGKGKFVQFEVDLSDHQAIENKLSELTKLYPGHGGVSKDGERLEIKGSHFEVSKIITDGLKLKLLSKDPNWVSDFEKQVSIENRIENIEEQLSEMKAYLKTVFGDYMIINGEFVDINQQK